MRYVFKILFSSSLPLSKWKIKISKDNVDTLVVIKVEMTHLGYAAGSKVQRSHLRGLKSRGYNFLLIDKSKL